MFAAEDVATVYALDLTPRWALRPCATLGLLPERSYREYRIYQSKRAVQPERLSPQLVLDLVEALG